MAKNTLNIKMAIIRYPMLEPLVAFTLYYGCDYTYEEVGNILGITRQGAQYVIEKFKEEADLISVGESEIEI